MGDDDEAGMSPVEEIFACLRAQLATQVATFGPDAVAPLITRAKLAHVLVLSGETDQAVGVLRPLILDLTRLVGEDHPATLGVRHNLCVAFSRSSSESSQADLAEHLEVLFDDELRVLGPDDAATVDTHVHLMAVLRDLGASRRAVGHLETLIDSRRATTPGDDPLLTIARLELVDFHIDAGDYGSAIGVLRALILAWASVAGPDDLRVLTYRSWVGRLIFESGDKATAVAHSCALLTDQIRVLGNDHPAVDDTRLRLAVASGPFSVAWWTYVLRYRFLRSRKARPRSGPDLTS